MFIHPQHGKTQPRFQFSAGPHSSSRCATLEVAKKTLWADADAHTKSDGAQRAGPRSIAPVASEAAADVTSPPNTKDTPSFLTARTPRGSSAEYLFKASAVDDLRARVMELQAPGWSTKAQVWKRVSEREARHSRVFVSINVCMCTCGFARSLFTESGVGTPCALLRQD